MHVNVLLGNFLKFVTKIAFIKAYILRKIENNILGGEGSYLIAESI